MSNKNEHSEKFEEIRFYYVYKMWNIKKVRNAVLMNRITADEFKEITGEDYVAD